MEDSLWSQRIQNANKYFLAWNNRYKCDDLEDYFKGFQWKRRLHNISTLYEPYKLNLIYSTIKIKLATLLFQRPSFVLSPTPGMVEWDMDSAVESTELKQNTLNTIIGKNSMNFTKHIKRAARDTFFRFGMIEVGYAADWRNPQKEDPYLKSWDSNDFSGKDRIIEDNEVPQNERFFIKRIKPKRFRVSVSDAEDLNDHEWCGYYEYFYTNLLMKTKGIKWPDKATTGETTQFAADFTGFIGDDGKQDLTPELQAVYQRGKITKVWHIWDLVSNQRLLLRDSDGIELWSQPNRHLPLIDFRWDEESDGFYPVPPVFQWLSPQDEINEAREQTRSYRRRFTRKFQVVEGQVNEDEKEKFVSGPDGVLITVKVKDAISAIANPEQGPTAENALLLAKDDFNTISATSAEARGQDADRETATQAKIVDARSQIRESAEQLDFADFICLIGREILVQAQENLTNGLWVKYNSNPIEQQPLQEVQVNKPLFKWIEAEDLSDDYDYTITVDINNATPAARAQAQQSFVQFIGLIQGYPMLAMSPVLIREAAYRCGYTNERVIHQIQQTAALSMAAKASQAANQQGMTLSQAQQATGGGNNPATTQIAQMATPSPQQTDTQINNQLQ